MKSGRYLVFASWGLLASIGLTLLTRTALLVPALRTAVYVAIVAFLLAIIGALIWLEMSQEDATKGQLLILCLVAASILGAVVGVL